MHKHLCFSDARGTLIITNANSLTFEDKEENIDQKHLHLNVTVMIPNFLIWLL